MIIKGFLSEPDIDTNSREWRAFEEYNRQMEKYKPTYSIVKSEVCPEYAALGPTDNLAVSHGAPDYGKILAGIK